MLFEGAIGDAYGAGFEYANENLKYNNLSSYIKHPTHGLFKGQYTDDTQMSIALAEMMLSDLEWNQHNIVNKFLECFKRDQRKGYSKRFQKFLEDTSTVEEFITNINPIGDSSGGAMRASCLGYIKDIDEVMLKCKIQCAITHNTADGIGAAQAASLLSWYTIHDAGNIKDVGDFIHKLIPTTADWRKDYSGKVKTKGWMSVQAAITAIRRNDFLSELLIDCINFSGDVDTVATIALSAASCSKEYKKDLPDNLVYGLEYGKFGRDYLIDLDDKLQERFMK